MNTTDYEDQKFENRQESGRVIENSRFPDCEFINCSFEDCRLEESGFRGCKLEKTEFYRCDMRKADFHFPRSFND